MTSVAVVVLVFAVVLGIGLVLRRWSHQRLATLDAQDEPDPADLADPGRWAPPPPADDPEPRAPSD